MANLDEIVLQLRKERDETQKRIEQLNQALAALASLNGTTPVRTRAQISGGKRRILSAAVRKRIAAAQRARWARWRAAKRK
jgi:hypothetical protein